MGDFYPSGGGGGSTAGPAGGDLSGSYPNPTVAQVDGKALPVGISIGGTGAITAALARTALAAAASGANSDITSLTGLTTALPITEGGTGATTAAAALAALAAGVGAGEVVGAAGSAVYPPGYEIGYDQITSSVSVLTTATTIITCSAHTFDGAPVMLEFYSPFVLTPTTSYINISLYESGSQLTIIGAVDVVTAIGQIATPVVCRYRFTPTAAAHSYVISAIAGTTTGTPAISASAVDGAYLPAFVRFTKV